jgi:hypothetical protein
MAGFGVREFQLHMLALMPPSRPVADALAELDASEDDARQALAAARDVGLLDPTHRIGLERSILPEPIHQSARPIPSPDDASDEFGTSTSLGFRLPVFRCLDYVVNVTTAGFVWGQHLARARGCQPPEITSPDELRPWRITRDEFRSTMRDVVLDEGFNSYEVLTGTLRGAGPARVWARFEFGLLQAAGVVPGAT